MPELRLTGPRGDNPLGFLAAMGALATLESAGIVCRLRWEGLTPILLWQSPSPAITVSGAVCPQEPCPTGHRPLSQEEAALILVLHGLLHRDPPGLHDQKELKVADKRVKEWRTTVKKKREEIKKRRLSPAERKQIEVQELEPLLAQLQQAEEEYHSCLARVSIDPALSLGDSLTAKNGQWTEFLSRIIELAAQTRDHRLLALVASYGIGDPNQLEESMLSTPWALVRGAGHQHFLGSVRQLIECCSACHLAKALFGPWIGTDEQCSLRLDPSEDRRYALMSADPTASDNRARTLWGANRLAFEALQFFPVYPSHPMGVVGWRSHKGNEWDDGSKVRWPLWRNALSSAAIHSLMRHPDLWRDFSESASGQNLAQEQRRHARNLAVMARRNLMARGVYAVFTSTRVRDDKRYNLMPGTACWMIPSSSG